MICPWLILYGTTHMAFFQMVNDYHDADLLAYRRFGLMHNAHRIELKGTSMRQKMGRLDSK